MSAKRLTANAVLIALYVVLSFVSLHFGFLKLSFSLLPIFMSALCFGAVDASLVGALASFIQQLLTYGVTATTALWMLPPVALGALVGAYAQSKQFRLTPRRCALTMGAGCLLVTTLNTLVMLIDGWVYHYPVAFTASVVGLRYLSALAMAAIYTLAVPRVVALVRKSGLTNGR